jgi:hypothetical protein
MAIVRFSELLAGDANNDNCIDFVGDVLCVAAKFGQSHTQPCNFVPSDALCTPWHADFDGSLTVDFVGDVLPLAANFGKCGEKILPSQAAPTVIAETGPNTQGRIQVSLAGERGRPASEVLVPLEDEAFDVLLNVQDMSSLYGYALEVRYGSGLAVIDSMGQAAQEGGFFREHTTEPTLFFTQHDETSHRIRLVGTLTGEHPGVNGNGEIAHLRFQRLSLTPGAIQIHWVELADAQGRYNRLQNQETLLLRVVPSRTQVLANYPNPFNPETWIPYHLAEGSEVELEIYNQQGKRIRRLELGYQSPGIYIRPSEAIYWDGRNQQGESVSSGLYFYHLRAGQFSQVRRMVLLK